MCVSWRASKYLLKSSFESGNKDGLVTDTGFLNIRSSIVFQATSLLSNTAVHLPHIQDVSDTCIFLLLCLICYLLTFYIFAFHEYPQSSKLWTKKLLLFCRWKPIFCVSTPYPSVTWNANLSCWLIARLPSIILMV